MIYLLLPAFNEEKSIPNLIPKIANVMKEKNADYKIVVVNDGSTDKTGEILEKMKTEYPLDVILHKINRGLGETERDGFEFIAETASDDDFVVRVEGDDTHDPQFIFSMLDKLNEGYDVVNTSRFQPGGGQLGVNLYRRTISRLANIEMKLVFGIKNVKDYSCGFRAYRAKVIKDAVKYFGNHFIQLKGLGFTSTLEIIVKLHLMGCRFAEVPFTLRYDLKQGSSKMVSSITTIGYLIMGIMYHWPFNGWKSQAKLIREQMKNAGAANSNQGAGIPNKINT